MNEGPDYKKPTLLNPFPDGVMPEVPGETFFSRLLIGYSKHLYFIITIGFLLATGAVLWWQGVSTGRAIDEYMFPTMAVRPADFRLDVLRLEELKGGVNQDSVQNGL